MTSFRRLAALPIVAALAFAAPTAQAVSIRVDNYRTTTSEGDHSSASKLRARPSATQKSGKQAQAMVCTTRQTTTKVGLFRRLTKSKSITVCTPAKSTSSNQPAGQGPVVETTAAGSSTHASGSNAGGNGSTGGNSSSGGNHNSGGSSNTGSSQNSGGSSNSNSSGSSNAGGNGNSGSDGSGGGSDGNNDTDEDTGDYVSDIIDSPPVFVPPAIGGDEGDGSEDTEGDAPAQLVAVPPNSVPEPGTLALLGLGLAGLGLSRRRSTK